MYIIKKSTLKNKKFDVFQDEKKITSFGAIEYEDYTMHNDEKRKANYIKRHKSNEDWSDPTSSGFWSRWILWNKKTISASITDTEKRFKIKISLQKLN